MDQIVLLDTHVFLWWAADRSRLSRTAARVLARAGTLLLADISLREIALLVARGRIELTDDPGPWMDAAIDSMKITVVEISPAIAARSTRIAPHFHDDPADQLITATAIEFDVPLVTADERLRASPAIRTIW
jgi:PIN domain nuclease of toxin-antitoxin system